MKFARTLATLMLSMSAFLLALTVTPESAHAENLIKQPGAHNQYKFELEPHLFFRYDGASGVGPGVRAAIPFMHNGPIPSINNNIGISFGADVPFYQGGALLTIPVAFQWNFYFTDIISVLGEAGLVNDIWLGGGGGNNFRVRPLFQGGGRFQFGKVGVLVRVGYPGMSVGANFQF